MLRLICFEGEKIWRKRSFLLAVCILFSVHSFALWYTLPAGEGQPPLSAYKALENQLSWRSEEEKITYMTERMETVEGVRVVETILAMQNFGNEQGEILAAREMETNPGVFEAYYGLYQSGEWILFTDTPEQEKALTEQVYRELEKTAGYETWLLNVRKNGEKLGGISIFGGGEKSGFSGRNLRKSAADYEALDGKGICFTPSEGLVRAMESPRTDLLLYLAVLLFAGSLVTEEKERRLFYVTRSTRRGILACMSAKLGALLLHCLLISVIFYGVNLVFYGCSAGIPDFRIRIQSLAPYMESPLSLSVGGFVALSLLTKAFVLFGMGTLCVCLGIRCELTLAPWLFGAAAAGTGTALYGMISPGSPLAPLKYLNPAGLMRTEILYGGYLNFNLWGHPVSRLHMAWGVTAALAGLGTACSLFLFAHMRSMEAKRLHLPFRIPFRPHVNLIRHEAYKILIMQQGLVVLLLSMALIGWRSLERSYYPSAGEQYYRGLMLRLEGELTQEKEQVVLWEEKRFEDAFRTLEQIEQMYEAGEISRDAADALEARENMTLYFYPSFQRVQAQYLHIKESGGCFVYDTGWLYFLEVWENTTLVNLLIQSVGIILAFSGVFAMEYQTGAILLLGSVKTGVKRTARRKILLCSVMGVALAAVAPLCRAIRISSVYPMGSLGADLRNISCFSHLAFPLPVLAAAALYVLLRLGAAVAATWVTLALSGKSRGRVQTALLSMLILSAVGVVFWLFSSKTAL